MSRFEVVGVCDICQEEVLEQDCYQLIDDTLYCPECYEDALNKGEVSKEDQ